MAISYAQQVGATRARPDLDAWIARVAFAGVMVCVAAVALAAAGAPSDQAFGRGLLELLIVGVPIAAGLYALRQPGNQSFGVALLGIGFLWSLTALTTSHLSVPFTIGRLTTWLISPCVVYLLLAFPYGRIEKGPRSRAVGRVLGRLAVPVLRDRAIRRGVPTEDVVVELRDE